MMFATLRGSVMAVLMAVGVAVALLPLFPGTASAAPGDPDTAFNQNVGATIGGVTPSVASVAVQPDGKVVVGGGFTSPSQGLARFEATGTPDDAFNANIGKFNGSVYSVALQPDGKIVVGGDFGGSAWGLARFNANGTPDTVFNTTVGSQIDYGLVESVAVQPDGKIVAAGNFYSPSQHLARFNADGTPDTVFNNNVGTQIDGMVQSVKVQPGGEIIVGGDFVVPGDLLASPAYHLARFKGDGTPDTEFNRTVGAQVANTVNSVAVQPDGKVVVGGVFWTPSRGLARFNADGTADTAFNNNVDMQIAGARPEVFSLAVQPDGKILAAGDFSTPSQYLARFNTDGTADTSFNTTLGTQIDGPVASLAVQTDGKIVGGGYFSTPSTALARFDGGPSGPGAPTGLQGTAGYELAQVLFTFGPQGSSPITGVEYSVNDGPWVATGSVAPQVTVNGLTNGVPVAVRVRAVNAAGPGAASAPVTVTPIGALFRGLETSMRAFDSRPEFGGTGPVTPATPVTIDTKAPPGAVAVAYNVTLVDTVGVGHVAVGPTGADLTGTSTANWFAPGQRWANAYVSELGPDGQVQVVARGTTQVVFDVTGYYLAEGSIVRASQQQQLPEPDPGDAFFTPIDPKRGYDSREAQGPIGPGQSRTVDLSALVPEGATGVAYTLTVADTTGSGHLSVGLPGQPKPPTSAINWSANDQNVANSATATLTANRSLEIFAGGGPTDFIVDVLGYFTPNAASNTPAARIATDYGNGLRFTPITPSRAYDSRTLDGPITERVQRTTSAIPANGEVPTGAGAVAFNLTEADTVDLGHLRVSPGRSALPSVSTINWYTTGMRLANGTVVAIEDDQMTTMAVGTSTNYIIDIGGYYN